MQHRLYRVPDPRRHIGGGGALRRGKDGFMLDVVGVGIEGVGEVEQDGVAGGTEDEIGAVELGWEGEKGRRTHVFVPPTSTPSLSTGDIFFEVTSR